MTDDFLSSEGAVETEVRTGLVAIRKTRGACPDTEALTRFHGGELSEEESAKVELHIASCGICDYLLDRVQGFEESIVGGEAATPEREWAGVERRLQHRLADLLRGLTENKQSSAFARTGILIRSFLLHPAFAYALAFLLLYPAYVGLFSTKRSGQMMTQRESSTEPPARPPSAGDESRQTVTTRENPTETAPAAVRAAKVVDLNRVRGANSKVFTLTDTDQTLILSFWVPIRRGLRYSAKIVDELHRNTIAELELTGLDLSGNFNLVCDRRLFPAGHYTLTVTEIDPKNPGAARQLNSFHFAM